MRTAMVVGVGKFGRHYVNILSSLDYRSLSIPEVDAIVVTKRSLEGAVRLAGEVQQNCTRKIIGAKVEDVNDLDAVLSEHRPDFIAITARDGVYGDSIHPDYVDKALDYGFVLCEKPFCSATEDGYSLSYLERFLSEIRGERFGLELPFVPVLDCMLQDARLAGLYTGAERIEFYWGCKKADEKGVMDDLILHPWSLIPENLDVEKILSVSDDGRNARVNITLIDRGNGKEMYCALNLSYDSSFRGMSIDGCVIEMKSHTAGIQVKRLGKLPTQATLPDTDGEVLLDVDNPLKRNIISALRGKPTTNLERAQKSQMFLEMCHRYRPD